MDSFNSFNNIQIHRGLEELKNKLYLACIYEYDYWLKCSTDHWEQSLINIPN